MWAYLFWALGIAAICALIGLGIAEAIDTSSENKQEAAEQQKEDATDKAYIEAALERNIAANYWVTGTRPVVRCQKVPGDGWTWTCVGVAEVRGKEKQFNFGAETNVNDDGDRSFEFEWGDING